MVRSVARGMNGTPRRIKPAVRRALWIALGTLFAIDCIVLIVASGGYLQQLPAVDVFSYLVPMGIAGCLAGILSRRAPSTLERSFWAIFALTFTALFLAECYWTWYVLAVDADGPPLSNPVTALYAVALVLFLSLVVKLTKPTAYSPWRYARRLIDVVVGAWACIPIIYWVWTYPLLGHIDGGGVLVATVAAIYPVVGAFIAGAALTTLWTLTPRRWRGWHWAVVSALWVFSATMVLYPVWRFETLATAGEPSAWYVALLGVALLIFVGAQISRLASDERPIDREEGEELFPSNAPRWVGVGYPVAVSCSLVWLGSTALVHGRDPEGPALVFFAWTLAILLAARSCLAAVELAAYQRSAHVDSLTGALVRSDFESTIADSVLVALDAQIPLSLIVVDMTSPRRSDGVLIESGSEPGVRQTLRAISRAIRATHGPFILGSTRFAYIMEEATAEQAREAALIAWGGLEHGGPSAPRPDLAFGIAEIQASSPDAQSLVSAANAAVEIARASDDEPVAVYDDRGAALDSSDIENRARMRALREAIRGLAQAVDARDPYTKDHSTNVSDLAAALAQVLGMSDADTQVVGLAALVHDVGKVGVSDDVLLAGDDLSAADRVSLRAHPLLGEAILQPARVDAVLPIVRHHHERWDGAGYPDGLSGPSIPEGARILAVVDSFEGMTASRSWRRAMSVDAALQRIEDDAGNRFDPAIARAFVRMVKALGTHGGTRPPVIGAVEPQRASTAPTDAS